MSRPLRIDYEGAWYHVMNPARRSDRIMAEEDSEEIEQLFQRKKLPPFLGDEKFAGWLRGKYFENKRNPQIPESSE
jgi:hypothetical protein